MRRMKFSLTKFQKYLPALQETLLHGLLALVITASVMTFPLDFIEAPLYDLRQWLSVKPTVDDRIVIITIDDQTLNQLNEVNPLNVEHHLQAIQKLEEHGVRAVGYYIDFNRVQRIDPTSFEKEVVQDLYRATVRLNAQGSPFMLGIPFDLNGEVTAPFPMSQVPQAIAIIHRDGTMFGKDKVTRRGLVSLYDRLGFEMALSNKIYAAESVQNPPGTYRNIDADAQYFLIRYHQNAGVIYDSNYETFSYPRYSFVDLIEGRIPDGTLRDKIVLVGTFQRENPNDFTLISSFDHYGLTPKILVHANILDSILNHQGIAQVPTPILAVFCFLLSLAIIVASFRVRPSRLILLTLYLILGTFAISFLLFQPIPKFGGFWLPLGAPLLSLALSFYLMIPLRLYSENRKRFELEKQNKMLLEVEEMKTNFLQLVTHDLKTPVARIQGLTESLKRSLNEKLGPKDHEMMNHILMANDDLNHFISALLELTKIDNQGVRVSLAAKDINQVLESMLIKLRFSAQSKGIQIITNFEPLFPIKFDANLIGKVLSNLIDNAIKYSPEQTRVTIETREIDSFVEVSIQDQGIGIPSEELPNLFSRFFRVKNDTTQKVKGTGLGLYLSKYFIEAHQGNIQVESQPGQGTKFTVRLPIDLSESNLVQIGLTTTQPQAPSGLGIFKKEKTHA